MASRLRPIGHEDRLSIVDHLDELRNRLIVCVVALVVTFGVCFWQNHALLELLNRPLEKSTPSAQNSGNGRISGVAAAQTQTRIGLAQAARALRRVATTGSAGSVGDRQQLGLAAKGLARAADALPKIVPKRKPITTGVGEPFTATLTVAFYFAVMLALPLLLYQIYAFVLPAFSPGERRVALPVMLGVPFLFIAGVAFGYFAVLPPAIRFLQNFNNDSFDVLLQAKDYYKFSILTLVALGLCFQVPIGMMALGRVGIVNRGFLIRNWRYAIVIIAVLAALLPGVDPVTTLLEMIPLLVLYVLSIFLVPVASTAEPDHESEWDSDSEPDDVDPDEDH
jgi:sec-independent protein translocase protein TatC